jgi:hypothetical protein
VAVRRDYVGEPSTTRMLGQFADRLPAPRENRIWVDLQQHAAISEPLEWPWVALERLATLGMRERQAYAS